MFDPMYLTVTAIIALVVIITAVYTVVLDRKQTKDILEARNKARNYSPSIDDDDDTPWL